MTNGRTIQDDPVVSYGTRFRLFGSRANQAMLACLAAFGPKRSTALAAVSAVKDSTAIHRLVKAGIVCRVPGAKARAGDFYALNAAHPVYSKLEPLCAPTRYWTKAFRFGNRGCCTDGPDGFEERQSFPPPYEIFGTQKKDARANIVATLAHTEHAEADAGSLSRLLSEHESTSILKALKRLAKHGALARRELRGLNLYRVNPDERAMTNCSTCFLRWVGHGHATSPREAKSKRACIPLGGTPSNALAAPRLVGPRQCRLPRHEQVCPASRSAWCVDRTESKEDLETQVLRQRTARGRHRAQLCSHPRRACSSP